LTDEKRGLVRTEYGRLVQVKITLFIAMFCLAAVNRLRLLSRLSQVDGSADLQQTERTLRQLRRNTAFEIALGLVAISCRAFSRRVTIYLVGRTSELQNREDQIVVRS
jgi:putative copper export protein